jgi:hypothetical protein
MSTWMIYTFTQSVSTIMLGQRQDLPSKNSVTSYTWPVGPQHSAKVLMDQPGDSPWTIIQQLSRVLCWATVWPEIDILASDGQTRLEPANREFLSAFGSVLPRDLSHGKYRAILRWMLCDVCTAVLPLKIYHEPLSPAHVDAPPPPLALLKPPTRCFQPEEIQ